jgi:hypothetical protein
MPKTSAKPHERLALKKEIRQIIEEFINSCKTAMGFITEELENIQKDLDRLTDEKRTGIKAVSEYQLLSNILAVTTKLKSFIMDKAKPSDLDNTEENNPLHQALLDLIEKPAFKSLRQAHEKIFIIQFELAAAYCDESLQEVHAKLQHRAHQHLVHELRNNIISIAQSEQDPIARLEKIRSAILETQKKVTNHPGVKYFGIFTNHDILLEAVLVNCVKNLPAETPEILRKLEQKNLTP